MKQTIIFFGSGSYTIPVVKKLRDHGLNLVVTTEKTGSLVDYCKETNIEFLRVSNAKDFTNHESRITNHDVGVLASYGAFVPEKIINSFNHGILNIHPSLLPEYKGPAPIQYTILNGEKTTGVTIIKLDNEIDHGPILSQKKYNLSGNETTEELLDKLFKLGAEMTEELMIKLENGEALEETPQNHSQESWSYKIEKKDGEIKLDSIPDPEKLDAMIRAYFPWPTVWFRYPVIASEARQSKLSGKLVKLLPNQRIQVEGKTPMSYKDFINGFGEEGHSLLKSLHNAD